MSLNLFERFLQSEQYIECLFGMEFERAWYAFLFSIDEFNEVNAKMYIELKEIYDEHIEKMIKNVEEKMAKPTCLLFVGCPYETEGECLRIGNKEVYCIVRDE